MNRFRRHKKKKAKDEVVHADKASTTTIISAISSRKDNNNNNNNNNSSNNNNDKSDNITDNNTSKKDDDPLPPKTPDLDLSTALPPPEDFRTSLIMPKLSARFSMLKDQDNPESMMGKASDDSVLFPKRASRLNLFGHNPSLLSDIDEMSMDGSRPSLGVGRSDSYASGSGDGYGTDDDRSQNGSIMSRARRADGNNLFGGRQKVYKIPAKSRGASPNPESRSGGGLGRAVYEHDVNLSAFQRMRLKEKEERAAAEQQHSPALESEDALSSIGSTNRTTYCSTASGPPPTTGRASTAATSIDEQPTTPQSLAPSVASNNNEGLAPKPLVPAMAAERGSAKTRRLYGQGLAQSVQNQQNSTLNRLENLSRQRPGTPELPLNRAYSRSATNLRDRLQALNVAADPPSRPTSPPLSSESPRPQIVENESKNAPPASGLPPLSPPISEVDEQQPQPLAAALQPEDHGKATALGLFNKPRAVPFDENQFTRRQLQMHQGRNTPPLRRPPSPPRAPQEPAGHSRALSNASYRSRANSGSSHYSESQRGMGTTFFANSSASESGDEGDFTESRRASQEEMDIHPALRSHTPSKPVTPEPHDNPNPLPEVRFSDLRDLKPIAENEVAEEADAQNDDTAPQEPDSPTLGPSGLGLSGLVRTHLRRDSDKSIHLPSPGLPPKTSDESPPEPQSVAEGASPDRTISAPSADNDHERQVPSEQAPSEPRTSSSSSSRNSTHRRNPSTETQREREEFANELAERRRRVQEKLQGFADDSRPGSRAGSPLPGRQTPDPTPKPGNAFALLKNRSGKHSLFQKSSAFGNSSTPSLALDQNDPWREEDERVPFPSLGSNQLDYSSPNVVAERPSVRSRVAAFTRSNSRDGSRESSRSRGTSPHSMTGFRARRDRSRSDASIRSKSRKRDDLETVDEGSVTSSHDTFQLPSTCYDPHANASAESSARPSTEASDSPYDRCSSVASGTQRSGSRSGTPSYFDLPPPPQNLPPPPAAMIGTSPRPSPIAPPYSANATPPLYEITPDPTSPPAPTFAAAASHVVPQRAPGHTVLPKRPVNKTLISEPTLVSSTSNVPTIGLPPGASLNNGMQTPPVPPMNPRRRRQTTTQTILGAFKGDKHDSQASSTDHTPSGSGRGTPDERSAFDDEFERLPLSRSRLRKTSSEGGSLNAKSRQEILSAGPPPPLPYPPPQHPPPGIPANMDGGMF